MTWCQTIFFAKKLNILEITQILRFLLPVLKVQYLMRDQTVYFFIFVQKFNNSDCATLVVVVVVLLILMNVNKYAHIWSLKCNIKIKYLIKWI